ncbi:tetratricopeptide repeat protein [Zhouia sp. PK063]|uniref:tetratricopeptide repeat protein n=1 Tax=Zhouia sp. PK063 TaxID=3373602 RepID=UPI00379B2034
MKNLLFLYTLLSVAICMAQQTAKEKKQAAIASNNFTYQGNQNLTNKDFDDAEVAYRKAIAKNDKNATAKYNLGNAYYEKNSYEEAFSRYKQAAETATTKAEKHKAYHNLGNVFMKDKQYEKAVSAYEQSLRNDPTDDETRYNLALAKEMLKKQQQQNKNNKDNKDKNKDNKDNKNNDKNKQNQDNKDKNGGDKKDQDQKNKDDKGDKGKDGDKKDQDKDKNQGDKGDQNKQKQDQKPGDHKGDQKDKGQPQPQKGQLSPQQVKNILKAMSNEEKKVQDKMNAKKAQGVKTTSEKDW